MYEFHYDYIKNKYDNKSNLLFTYADSFMHEIKTEDVYEDFSSDKQMLDFSNYLTKSKYYDDSNRLVIGKVKNETGSAAIEESVGLKPKMHSFLVGNNEHKKAKGVNKNVVATISHNKYEDVLLNKKCLRHSMNMIQSKDHKIGTYKISLSCFDDKIYIQNNGWDGLLELIIPNIKVNYTKTVILLITISISFFVKQIVLIFSLVRPALLLSIFHLIFSLVRTAF